MRLHPTARAALLIDGWAGVEVEFEMKLVAAANIHSHQCGATHARCL